MVVYTVHERDGVSGGTAMLADRLDHAEFVRDGFSWPAFLLGPIWLLRYRLWRPLAIWIAVVFGLSLLAGWIWGSPDAGSWVWLGGALVLGFEAGELRRAGLEEQGYRGAATVSGATQDECELKFAHMAIGDSA